MNLYKSGDFFKEIVYDDIKEIYTKKYMYMDDLLHHQGIIFLDINYIFV